MWSLVYYRLSKSTKSKHERDPDPFKSVIKLLETSKKFNLIYKQTGEGEVFLAGFVTKL